MKPSLAPVVLLSAFLAFFVGTSASASTMIVTSANDVGGPGTLRSAVSSANPGDSIVFAANLSGQTILLTSGQIAINQNLTIDGSALTNGIQLNGNGNSRIFSVASGASVVLNALTITNGFDNSSGGGGVYNSGTLTVNNCTFSGNVTTSGYGGGGIHNNSAILAVNNCTLSGNTANYGGGIGSSGGTLTVVSCTISGNSASVEGGGIIRGNGTIDITNSIVAGNTAPSDPSTANFFGAFSGSNDLTNGSPDLAPLGNYGGPTQTMPPLPGSPAIGTGSLAATNGLTTDQRGLPRVVNGLVDIGSVESVSPVPGPLGYSLFFGGSQSVDVTNFGANAISNEVTVEFWAYSTAPSGSTFILNPDSVNNRFFSAVNGNDGNIRWDFGNSLGAGHLITNSLPNSISNWVHYAFVASAKDNCMRIYTNGNLYSSQVGMTPFVSGSFTLRIGEGYVGSLDEFRVWNTALSQAQILATMNTSLTGNEPNLILYFPFDSCSGNDVTNLASATGSANDGVAAYSPYPGSGVEPPGAGAAAASLAYTFTTFAGGSSAGSVDGVGDTARFATPYGTAVDTNGNIFVSEKVNNTIREITPAGVVTTFAGLAGSPGNADGTNSSARFNSPQGLAIDSVGNLYVADTGNDRICKITPAGVVSTIGYTGGIGIAVDSSGAVYAENGYMIVKFVFDGTNWNETQFAGTGALGNADGKGTNATFDYPGALATDLAGDIYVGDGYPDYAIRKITPGGFVTTIAGGVQGHADGLGTNAQFYAPFGIAVDNFTNIYVGDGFAGTIRQISPAGTNWNVTTIAGVYMMPASVDGTGTNARFSVPCGVAVDSSGNLYVADNSNNNIRKITSAVVVSTLAGPGNSSSYLDGTGANARFNRPSGVTVDNAGNIYVADTGNQVIRKITSAGVVSTLAGQAGVTGIDDGAGSDAHFLLPYGVVTDRNGNVYVTVNFLGCIRKITPAGEVSTIAGSPISVGYLDGPTNIALFTSPAGITIDHDGNLYVAEQAYNTIRMISTNGVVSTVAGFPELDPNGNPTNGYDSHGHIGDYIDGNGTNARFNYPTGIAIDAAGNLYVADTANFVVRKIIAPTTGSKSISTNWSVTTLAGVGGSYGSSDGVGSGALFGYSGSDYNNGVLGPTGIAIDSSGNLFVTDDVNNSIRKITPAGAVTTIAGLAGTVGSVDGTGDNARFDAPFGIAVDASGAVYVADVRNNTIRKGTFTQFGPANVTPIIQPPPVGQIQVTLLPPEAGGQWRFPWEQVWRNSGDTATNLVSGSYPIEFRAEPGYVIVPLAAPVPIPAQGGLIQLTNQYFPTVSASDTNSGGGSLSISFVPSPPNGARWQIVGASNLLASGFTTNLPSGNYLINFTPVPGFVTPEELSVQVVPQLPTVLLINYALAQSVPANFLSLPVPVPANEISDLTDYPFGFNGQLETDVGFGSGVAVDANVVLTAAHLVFDDQTLAYVSQANWFFQTELGVFAPDPLPARGWYVLSGYAAERTNDVLAFGPDVSTPQSRNTDVAALYFQSPMAGGGYGGYLPSDAVPNTWLAGAANKMLVGYPVDGSQFGVSSIVNGLMYEAGPQTLPLTIAPDPVADQQVYEAPWLLSYPGNSGGPLYVELNGYYYPAGVYLGTLFNGIVPYASAIRAIDSNVVNLITLASTLGDTGTNNSGGGVITIIPSQNINVSHPGYLLLQLGPTAAVQAGAAWKLTNQPSSYYSTANPSLQEVTTTNALALGFKQITGWILPTNRSVSVLPGVILTNFANYTVANPVLTLDTVQGLGITGTTNTRYQIQSNSVIKGGTWIPFSTNTLTLPGVNIITNKPRPGFYRAVWLTN